MKNVATTPDGSGETQRLPDAWRDALTIFDRDLRRRGAAERTRRAYGVDLGQLAGWCGARSIDPEAVDYKTLRRYAAHLSERKVAATTVARKLAATRQFFASQVEHGHMGANPAELLPMPGPPQPLPRSLNQGDVATLLDSIPATTPLEWRDRALFEVAYSCGLRAEELVTLDC